MYVKVVLVLVLAAAAVQSSANVEEQVGYTRDTKPIHHLKEIIEKAVKAEKEALKKLHKELSEQIKVATKYGKIKFHKQIHASFEKIRKLVEQAHKNKVNIKACLKNRRELKYLPNEFHKKITACDKDISTKSRALVVKEKKTVRGSLHVIRKLRAELRACGKSAESLKCTTKVAAEISKALQQEPAKIKKTVNEAVPSILHLVPSAQKCVTIEIHELIAKEAKIAKEVESCITEKLHSHKKA